MYGPIRLVIERNKTAYKNQNRQLIRTVKKSVMRKLANHRLL